MADYKFYLDYLRHLDDDSEKVYRQRENDIRQEMEDKLQSVILSSQRKIQDLEDKCREIKNKGNEALRQEKVKFEKELEAVQKKNTDDRNAEAARTRASYQEAFLKLEQDLASLTAERSASNEKLKSFMEKAKVDQKKEKAALSQQYEDEISSLKAQITSLSKVLSETTFRSEQYENEISSLKAQITSLSKMLSETKSVIKEYEARIGTLKTQHEKELTDLNQQFSKAADEFQAKVSSGVQNLKTQNAFLQNKLKEKDAEIETLKTQARKKGFFARLFGF